MKPNYKELIEAAYAGWTRQGADPGGLLTNLYNQTLADTTAQPKASTTEPTYNIPEGAILIEFDGGTPCNVPSRGYGNGYGSYRINRGEIRKAAWGPMSANTAEIKTLTEAIAVAAVAAGALRRNIVHLVGDSQIALKWADVCAGNRKSKISKKSSPEFRKAIADLSRVIMHYSVSLTTEWHGRANSVRIFGH